MTIPMQDITDTALAALHCAPWNPRSITDKRFADLKRSLEREPEMLRARPIIALLAGTVLAGNMRFRAAQALGWKTIPCVHVDLDENAAKGWALRYNNEYGEWDDDALAEMIYELQEVGYDLDMTGFSSEEIEKLIKDVAGGADDDKGAGGADDDKGGGDDFAETWSILIECANEEQQALLLARFEDEGLKAKALIS